jgi:hypothetical protein
MNLLILVVGGEPDVGVRPHELSTRSSMRHSGHAESRNAWQFSNRAGLAKHRDQ